MEDKLTAPWQPTKSLIFLASPYSHESAKVREIRYNDALEITTAILRRGRFIFSPIVFCHHIALQHKLPKDAAYWEAYNEAMLKVCDELYILCINGIDTSKGVHREIILAESISMRRTFVEKSLVSGDVSFISPRRARITWRVQI